MRLTTQRSPSFDVYSAGFSWPPDCDGETRLRNDTTQNYLQSEGGGASVSRRPLFFRTMNSYDEIQKHLREQLDAALEACIQGEQPEASQQILAARDRYDRFTLHGMIPDDIAE